MTLSTWTTSLITGLWLSLSTTGLQAAESMEQLPPALTVEEAANLLRIDIDTLELMATANTIPGRRLLLGDGTQTFRFSRDALIQWLENAESRQATTHTPELGTASVKPPAETSTNDLDASASSRGTDETIGTEREQPTSTEVFLRNQSLTSTAGEVGFDLGIFYSRQDNQVLVIDDNPRLETTTNRIGLIQGVVRYSSNDDTDIFVRGSAEWRDARLRLDDRYQRINGENSRTNLAVGVRHVFIKEGVGRPELILGLEGRVPTGTSSSGASASLSFVKSLDPAVLFGSIAYTHIDSERFSDTTILESEHTTRFDIGYALAMSDRFSLNVSMEAGYRSRTQFDDIVLPEDDYAGLQIGVTIKMSPTLYIQPVIGYSLSGIGGAYTFGVSIPLNS